MEIVKAIIDLVPTIALTIAGIILPIKVFNFKWENRIIRIKTDRGRLIDQYGMTLFFPLWNLIMLLMASDQTSFVKSTVRVTAILIPLMGLIVLTYNTWKFSWKRYVTNKSLPGLGKTKALINPLFAFFLWLCYLIIFSTSIFFSYMTTRAGNAKWQEYLTYYMLTYLTLSILYLLIGRVMIGGYKKEFAKKIKIAYVYKGRSIEKEADYNDFSVKGEYVNFYVENDKKKYIIPWDKVNFIEIEYK